MKKTYHHLGIHVTEDIPGVGWIDLGDVMLNNPNHHPQKVEWIYHKPGTYDPNEPFKPHICYTVDDLDAAIAGKEIAIPPFEPGDPPFGRAAFTMEDGIAVEYIELYPGRQWFDDAIDS